MKKYLVLMLVMVLCLAMFTGVHVNAFSDVTDEHRHSDAITYLTEKEVINGYEDGSFKPENTITRAEFLKMMFELMGIGNIYGDQIVNTGFTDVDAKAVTATSKNEEGKEESNTAYNGQHWAAGYIKLAVDKKVVNGYGNGKFGPDDPVKYEEAIKMIVCCLGREEYAKTRAQTIGKDVWPHGYLSIGNDLTVAKSTEYMLGENASRSNVAQMLYNVKDVPVIIPSTVTVEGFNGGGFGGGGGGSTGSNILGSTSNNVGGSTTVVKDLYLHGQVVAAVKKDGESLKPIIIDDSIIIDGQPVTNVTKNYLIVKLETQLNGNGYMQLYIGSADYSRFLGQKVKVKYRYNPSAGNDGRYEVDNITAVETEYIEIAAENIKRGDTIDKNGPNLTQYYLCYTDGDRDYDEPLFTDDLDTLKVIYNNKVVDVTALGDDPSVKSDVITLNDIMPQIGKVILVNANEDMSIDLVWIESYETYVVGIRNFNAVPKSITDKFRTTDGTTPLTLTLDDAENSPVKLNITENGVVKKVIDIPQNNTILKVAQSKCGTSMDVVIERATSASGSYKSTRTDNTGRTIIELSNGKTYRLNDYFTTYVEPTLEYAMGDNVTLYLNSSNEIVWMVVKEATYATGYLIKTVYDAATDELSLDILTTEGKIKTFKMAQSNTKYITKAYNCLSEFKPSNMTNPNGYLYKNLSNEMIEKSLRENADLINYGEDGKKVEGSSEEYATPEEMSRNKDKPARILTNATIAQPIMYTTATVDTLSHLVTVEPDVPNRYIGTSLKYKKSGYNFGDTFSASSESIFIFVPNNRQSNEAAFKIGKISSSAISQKLVQYAEYNIEPYYTTTSTGTRARNIFVVYNEDIDAVPTYRTENMVVSEVKDELTANNNVIWKITGYVASTTSTKTYTTSYEYVVKQAYVLDENFERTGVKRAVEVGDVIRVGYFPAGTSIASVDIILDASVDQRASAPKATAVKKNGEAYDLSTSEPEDYAVSYFARIGEIVAIDSAEVKEWCDIKISETSTDRVGLGTGFNTRKILMYDHRATNDPGTEKDDRLKVVTMGEDLWGGEILYVWQGENLDYKQIYAIRYPVAQP